MAIQKIDDIYEALKANSKKKRLVVAYANDSHSIEAVNKAVELGMRGTRFRYFSFQDCA